MKLLFTAGGLLYPTFTNSSVSVLNCIPALGLTVRDYAQNYAQDGSAVAALNASMSEVRAVLADEAAGIVIDDDRSALLQMKLFNVRTMASSPYVVCGEGVHASTIPLAWSSFILFSLVVPLMTFLSILFMFLIRGGQSGMDRRKVFRALFCPPVVDCGRYGCSCAMRTRDHSTRHASPDVLVLDDDQFLATNPSLGHYTGADFRATQFYHKHIDQLSLLVLTFVVIYVPSPPSNASHIMLQLFGSITIPTIVAFLIFAVSPFMKDREWMGYMKALTTLTAVLAAVLNAVQANADMWASRNRPENAIASPATLSGLAIMTFAACILLFLCLTYLFFRDLISGAQQEQQVVVARERAARERRNTAMLQRVLRQMPSDASKHVSVVPTKRRPAGNGKSVAVFDAVDDGEEDPVELSSHTASARALDVGQAAMSPHASFTSARSSRASIHIRANFSPSQAAAGSRRKLSRAGSTAQPHLAASPRGSRQSFAVSVPFAGHPARQSVWGKLTV